MRAQQTVSEMVVESLARQAQALSERSGRPFEKAFEEVLKTPAGYRLAELSDGPHRHEKAAEWQAELLADHHPQLPKERSMAGTGTLADKYGNCR